MRYLALIFLLPALALAGPTYVAQWPDRVPVAGGVCFRPSPAQCRAAGYELEANRPAPTAEEIAAAKAAEDARKAEENARKAAAAKAAAEGAASRSNQQAKVRAMLESYHVTTRDLCALAGVAAPATNELTAAQIDASCFALLDDVKDADKIKRNIKIMALAIKLQNLSIALSREGVNVAR
jgi:hypothetical protein